MLCDYCQTNPVSVQLNKVIGEKRLTLKLCSTCAEQQRELLDQQFPQADQVVLDGSTFQRQLHDFSRLLSKIIDSELHRTSKFQGFAPSAQKVIEDGLLLAYKHQHKKITPTHLLAAFLETKIAKKIFDSLEIPIDKLKKAAHKLLVQYQQEESLPASSKDSGEAMRMSGQLKRVLELAKKQSTLLKQREVYPEHLLLGIVEEHNNHAFALLQDFSLTPVSIKLATVKATDRVPHEVYAGSKNSKSTPALDHFTTDMTALAAEGALDPVIGRDEEIQRVIQVLCRRTKNNPVLIGEPGVGKTAIVDGLAHRIVNGAIPSMLRNKRVLSLDITALVAGTRYRGEFEERIHRILEEVKKTDQRIILFIDELHTVVGAGSAEGTLDGSNILKPDLAKGTLQCIGATTLEEYRKYIEKDTALERRFQSVNVREPSIDQSIAILQGLKKHYEEHHEVRYTDAALEQCVRLAKRYIHDRFLPDKAIDCMDEAAVVVRLQNQRTHPELQKLDNHIELLRARQTMSTDKQEYEEATLYREEIQRLTKERAKLEKVIDQEQGEFIPVDVDAVERVIASWTHVPVQALNQEERSVLRTLNDKLSHRVIGQDKAIESIAATIRRARMGLGDGKRPHGSFLFLGATGVGKTHLARVLAEEVYGSSDALVKIDMSEYMEKYAVSKLIGSPPGYVGYDQAGQLTEKVRRMPYCVVLFDELEKAHHEVYNLLLQILEDGVLTDAHGRKISFHQTIVIATSNLGGDVIQHTMDNHDLGFAVGDSFDSQRTVIDSKLEKRLRGDLKKHFNPEFLARIDEVIFFNLLQREHLETIFERMFDDVVNRIEEKGLVLSITPTLREKLIAQSHAPTAGARKLRTEINRIEKLIAARLLEEDASSATLLIADWEYDDIVIHGHADTIEQHRNDIVDLLPV